MRYRLWCALPPRCLAPSNPSWEPSSTPRPMAGTSPSRLRVQLLDGKAPESPLPHVVESEVDAC
eukprot:829987-Rhodomonas_salina.1